MLRELSLKEVGPVSSARFSFADRLNILTGDNGLGKTFVLDLAWWVLTKTWAGPKILGRRSGRIDYSHPDTTGIEQQGFNVAEQAWTWEQNPHMVYTPGLIVYAQVDGSFSVWDHSRNPRVTPKTDETVADWVRGCAFRFPMESVWNGLPEQNGKVRCNGLIRDWVSWQFQHREVFDLLCDVLAGLSPGSNEPIRPGRPTRVHVDDSREFPTIELPYGTVPVVHASAGMRRILALAYLLVWSWTEHKAASKLRGQESTDRLVLLIDEVEAHLHPQWQRVILPSMLSVVEKLRPDIRVQVIATTHAPLVLASLETIFDESRDRVFTFDLHDGQVSVTETPWAKQGDVTNWLVSNAFGLQQARSRDAERAIEAAEAYMRGDSAALSDGLKTEEAIHAELQRVLAGHDPFWPRWIVHQRNAS